MTGGGGVLIAFDGIRKKHSSSLCCNVLGIGFCVVLI